ncbi:MAG: site-specific DNA-methyltransferase [Candidatus Hadarchaeales archaeon]
MTIHKIIFGDASDMRELPDSSVHCVVTSPPYFNAPFDYPGLFKDYSEYLDLIRRVFKELRRVLVKGRVACFVTQDVRIDRKLYPVPADIVRIAMEEGFIYRDRIIWRKPEGYIRISRRSGVLIQHQLPMYFYPDNIYEEILILQNGEMDYDELKKLSREQLEASKINLTEFQNGKWYLSVWDITNVLPLKGRPEEGIAAFPEEIPRRLIQLFSFKDEVILDPFLGSGTTTKAAMLLNRNSVGYEIDLELEQAILRKLGVYNNKGKLVTLDGSEVYIVKRADAKRLRTSLQQRVKEQPSVTDPKH